MLIALPPDSDPGKSPKMHKFDKDGNEVQPSLLCIGLHAPAVSSSPAATSWQCCDPSRALSQIEVIAVEKMKYDELRAMVEGLGFKHEVLCPSSLHLFSPPRPIRIEVKGFFLFLRIRTGEGRG